MEYLKLCDSDYRFMSIVWDYAPIPSGKLVKLCNEILGWKKSTTYTTIKKMSEKGYIKRWLCEGEYVDDTKRLL